MWIRFLSIFIFVFCALDGGIPVSGTYVKPTEAFIKRTSWKKIRRQLKKQKIPQHSMDFFQQIPSSETWGHIGYHGSTRSYRIYQDIIRMVVEEILAIEVRNDFQFLRVPGDEDFNLNSISEFEAFWGNERINNRSSNRSKQLLSLNFCLYSNYKSTHSSAIYYFVKNSSSNENIDYKALLGPFFSKLGIDPNALEELFSIGERWIPNGRGMLLQLSENSHKTDPNGEAYNFADQHAYPAKRRGYRYGNTLISTHYQRLMSSRYIRKKVDVAPQLRLLMNNRYTLNPYSHLIVRRWEETDPTQVANYETELRAAIRALQSEAEKVALFREQLLEQWL